MQDLDAAVLGGFKGSFKLDERQTPVGYYVAYSVPGKFRDKPDTVELLLKPEGVQDRQWEGDRAGAAVFYRSIAGAPESTFAQMSNLHYAKPGSVLPAGQSFNLATHCHSLQDVTRPSSRPFSILYSYSAAILHLYCHLPPPLRSWRCGMVTCLLMLDP